MIDQNDNNHDYKNNKTEGKAQRKTPTTTTTTTTTIIDEKKKYRNSTNDNDKARARLDQKLDAKMAAFGMVHSPVRKKEAPFVSSSASVPSVPSASVAMGSKAAASKGIDEKQKYRKSSTDATAAKQALSELDRKLNAKQARYSPSSSSKPKPKPDFKDTTDDKDWEAQYETKRNKKITAYQKNPNHNRGNANTLDDLDQRLEAKRQQMQSSMNNPPPPPFPVETNHGSRPNDSSPPNQRPVEHQENARLNIYGAPIPQTRPNATPRPTPKRLNSPSFFSQLQIRDNDGTERKRRWKKHALLALLFIAVVGGTVMIVTIASRSNGDADDNDDETAHSLDSGSDDTDENVNDDRHNDWIHGNAIITQTLPGNWKVAMGGGYGTGVNPSISINATVVGEENGHQSGYSIALSSQGRTLLVGEDTQNRARIFQRTTGTTWTILGHALVGPPDSVFGRSTAISDDGTVVAVGGRLYDQNTGLVRVYQYGALSNWTQIGPDLVGDAREDNFGRSLGLSSDGRALVVGATQWSGVTAGYVRVFDYQSAGREWIRRGGDIVGKQGDFLGWDVDITGDGGVVVVGTGQGKYVAAYRWNGMLWSPHGTKLYGPDTSTISLFGSVVSISSNNGDVLVIGDSKAGDNFEGAVYVYEWDEESDGWIPRGNGPIRGQNSGDRIGHSISISGNGLTVAIGVGYKSMAGVQILTWNNTDNNWEEMGDAVDGGVGASGVEASGGVDVALSRDGNFLAVGLNRDDSYGMDRGKTVVYDWMAAST